MKSVLSLMASAILVTLILVALFTDEEDLEEVADVEPTIAETQQLRPVDEADEEASFFLFRMRLIEALAARDTSFLYAHLAPDVHSSFGGHVGPEDFRAMWRPAEPDSELWPLLARIVAGGGQFDTDAEMFHAPYYHATWPDLDPYVHAVILGEQVRMREEPRTDAPVVAELSYDIVELQEFGDQLEWYPVQLEDDRTGYVHRDFIAQPIGYRAGFRKENGTWMLAYFLAGD